MINASRLGRPPAIRTGAPVLSDGRWWRATKHALDGVAPLAVLSPASGRSMLNGRAVNDNALISRQGGIKYVVGADGVLTLVPTNTLAYDWSSGVRELLFEGQATNYVANNGNAGAVVGTLGAGGAVPTGWGVTTGYSGLTVAVTGIGSTNGIPWVELRVQGTNNSGGVAYVDPWPGVMATAAVGQAWTYSQWAEKLAGAWPGATGGLGIAERTSGGSHITGTVSASKISAWGRYEVNRTFTNATAGLARGYLDLSIPAGAVVDVTFRLGRPQLEMSPVATSCIPTSGSAVTRPADIAPLWAGAGDATAWAWRGNIPARIADWLPILMAGDWAILSGDNSNPAKIGLWGNIDKSGVIPDVASIPGSIGFCGGWGASGRVASSLGSPVASDNKLVNRDLSSLYIAGASGLLRGQVLRLRELVAWQLSDRPSVAGCQAQARLWSV